LLRRRELNETLSFPFDAVTKPEKDIQPGSFIFAQNQEIQIRRVSRVPVEDYGEASDDEKIQFPFSRLRVDVLK
jgi:hypothetical protein